MTELAEKYELGKFVNPAEALHSLAGIGLLLGHRDDASHHDPDKVNWGSVYDAIFETIYSTPDDARDVFKKIIKDANPKINWAHLALGELAKEGWVGTTITTNFDLLVLEGYARAGLIPVVSDGIESLDRIDGKPDHQQLIQINGSVHTYRLRNRPTELSELGASAAAITFFRNLFQQSRVFVVVGYDGREPQTMTLLEEAAQSYPDKHVYWCLHSSNPGDLSERAAKFLNHSNNSRLIVGQDADAFFYELSDSLGVGAPLALREPIEFMQKRLLRIFDASIIQDAKLIGIQGAIDAAQSTLKKLSEPCIELPDVKSGATNKPAPKRRSIAPKTADPKKFAASLARAIKRNSANKKLEFASLRRIQDDYYLRGRDRGINFDLLVSVELARFSVDVADGPDQGGAALNDLGIALGDLGGRAGDEGPLRDSVHAYRAALQKYTRERVPLEWATAQNNLGGVLLALGERRGDTVLLQQAVDAFRAALEERKREQVPLYWAMTQNNLGNALRSLADRSGDTALLQQAVEAYSAALQEYTRERVPLEWAAAQNNLGGVILALGERSGNTVLLQQAVDAFRAALEERKREQVPLYWAMTQNNLGNALRSLADRSGDTALLQQAVEAFREALRERTRERVPLDWAATQNNLGVALESIGNFSGETALLLQAVAAYRAALLEYTRERVPLNWATTQNNLAEAQLSLFRQIHVPADWRAADRTNTLALSVLRTFDASDYLAKAEATRAKIDAARPEGIKL